MLRRGSRFAIGPIGRDNSEERKHADFLLQAIIKHVLEAEEFGYAVKRADEDADPGMISDRMISDIINADLVVADLTGLNNLAHRAIFVDTSDWHSIETARMRLAASARAIKSSDYRVSNPITLANASFAMRTSADPNERLIADLQDRVLRLEAREARATVAEPLAERNPTAGDCRT